MAYGHSRVEHTGLHLICDHLGSYPAVDTQTPAAPPCSTHDIAGIPVAITTLMARKMTDPMRWQITFIRHTRSGPTASICPTTSFLRRVWVVWVILAGIRSSARVTGRLTCHFLEPSYFLTNFTCSSGLKPSTSLITRTS